MHFYYQSYSERGYSVTKASERDRLGNHAHGERIGYLLFTPVAKYSSASRGRFNNASVACVTKQRGCSSEGMEENLL